MSYVSTRGGAAPQRFSDILLEGLAPDGGLYVPESFPPADLVAWRGLGAYAAHQGGGLESRSRLEPLEAPTSTPRRPAARTA